MKESPKGFWKTVYRNKNYWIIFAIIFIINGNSMISNGYFFIDFTNSPYETIGNLLGLFLAPWFWSIVIFGIIYLYKKRTRK